MWLKCYILFLVTFCCIKLFLNLYFYYNFSEISIKMKLLINILPVGKLKLYLNFYISSKLAITPRPISTQPPQVYSVWTTEGSSPLLRAMLWTMRRPVKEHRYLLLLSVKEVRPIHAVQLFLSLSTFSTPMTMTLYSQLLHTRALLLLDSTQGAILAKLFR